MTAKNESIILDRINKLEGKIDRIEQLLLLIMDEAYLTEDELDRISQADEIVKENDFDKLVLVE